MLFKTIITCHETASHLDTPDWVFADCRTSMADREYGYRAYQQSHLPHAVYAGLGMPRLYAGSWSD